MSRSFRQPKRIPLGKGEAPGWFEKKLENRADKAALKRRQREEEEMKKLLEKYDAS